jgi:uncharacterized membrane protein YphA (DoxX/SURF4 family)
VKRGGAVARWEQGGWLALLARLVLGGVFLGLGLMKAADPVAFLKAVRQFGVVAETSPLLLNGMAALLPWLEIWCGLLLVAGVGVRGAALVQLVLLIVFTAAIGSRGLDVQQAEGLPFCAIAFDCGCGTGVVNVCSKLLQNVGLMALSLIVLASRSSRFCLRHALLGPPRPVKEA